MNKEKMINANTDRNQERAYYRNISAIVAVFAFSSVGAFENAAVQRCIEAWPAVSVTAVRNFVTLPLVVSAPVMLLAGTHAGKRFSFRSLMICGCLAGIIGGILPAFYAPSWGFVLFCRAVTGIGTGLLGVRGILLAKCVRPSEFTHYMGLSQAFLYIATLIANPIGGVLADIRWNASCLINLLGIPVLLMVVFWMREPAKQLPEEETMGKADTLKKDSLSDRTSAADTSIVFAGFVALLQFVITGVKYPIISGMSTLIDGRNLGGAAVAGIMIAVYSAGAAVSGFFLNTLRTVFKKSLLSLSIAMLCLTAVIVLYAGSLPGIAAGAFICGFVFNIFYSLNQIYIMQLSPEKWKGIFSTMVIAFNFLGIFISNYFIAVCQSIFRRGIDVESALIGGALCFLPAAVLCYVFRNRIDRKRE